jgi:TP53 regulating kinase-like protein
MHDLDICHGDLTTSNTLVRMVHQGTPDPNTTGLLTTNITPGALQDHPQQPVHVELVLIDFGLAFTSALVEDKAIDLLVLERALNTWRDGAAEHVFRAYARSSKRAGGVMQRLEQVRLRGRKRSMAG